MSLITWTTLGMTFTSGNLFFVEAYGSSDHLIDLYGSEDMDLKFWKSDSVVSSLNKPLFEWFRDPPKRTSHIQTRIFWQWWRNAWPINDVIFRWQGTSLVLLTANKSIHSDFWRPLGRNIKITVLDSGNIESVCKTL